MTQPVQEPNPQRDLSGLGWGERQLARRPAPPSGTGGEPTIRAVLFDGAGDVSDSTEVPLRFSQAYILNDPGNDYFALTTTNLNDPDAIDRLRLQLVKTTGWYRVECVMGIDQSGPWPINFSAYLKTEVSDHISFVDHRVFLDGESEPYGPFLRTYGEFDGGATWWQDDGAGAHYVDPVFFHTDTGVTLGHNTVYMKAQYLGDMGDVNAAPWEFTSL